MRDIRERKSVDHMKCHQLCLMLPSGKFLFVASEIVIMIWCNKLGAKDVHLVCNLCVIYVFYHSCLTSENGTCSTSLLPHKPVRLDKNIFVFMP